MQAPEQVEPPPDYFGPLAAARQQELAGWTDTAHRLWILETRYPGWWKLYDDTKAAVLASPELQLSSTTAQQYVRTWEFFRQVDLGLLRRSRPRLLYQATYGIEQGIGDAQEAAEDATALSWSSYVLKWRPDKSPLNK